MKNRTAWAFAALAALLLGAIYFWRHAEPAPAPLHPPVATKPAPSAAAPAASASDPMVTVRAGRHGEPVTVPDGQTIDMSSGRPVVVDDPRSRAALAQGVKEMAEAAATVTFTPQPAPPAEKKKPDATAAPAPAPKP
jgi:hypothetical protein